MVDDNFADDAELLDGFEEESGSDQERKVNAFLQEVNVAINKLNKRDEFSAAERREAALWLGESGETSAVPPLVRVYQKDKTPGMKQAAAYALGQFRALEIMLLSDDEDDQLYARQLAEDIILDGKFGQPARPSNGTLLGWMGGLLVTALVIFGLALVLPDALGNVTAPMQNTPQPTATYISDSTVITNQLLESFNTLDADTRTLQAQFQAISRQEAPDCAASYQAGGIYAPPAPYFAPGTFPEMDRIVNNLNQISVELATLRQAMSDFCAQTLVITRQESVDDYQPRIIELQTQLVGIPDQINSLNMVVVTFTPLPTLTPLPVTPEPEANGDAPSATPPPVVNETLPPTATATPITPTMTSTPTLTPEPTLDAAVVNVHINSMDLIINSMSGFRGANSLVRQYWQDVQNTGSTGACLEPQPPIPSDYTVPPDLANKVPELTAAAGDLNLALDLTRQTWRSFTLACERGTLAEEVQPRLAQANLAATAYNDAQAKLNALRQQILAQSQVVPTPRPAPTEPS